MVADSKRSMCRESIAGIARRKHRATCRPLQISLDIFRRIRQRPAPLAAGGEYRVADRGLDRGDGRRVQSAWSEVAADELHVDDLRRLVHARNAIAVEVALLDGSVANADF